MSDAILAYAFWVQTGRPWDVNGLRTHFEQRKMEKAIRRNRFDMEKYRALKQAIKQVEERLEQLN